MTSNQPDLPLNEKTMNLSIVLPCYNEGETLDKLSAEYRTALADIPGVELILVDNGSTDNTMETLRCEVEKPSPFPMRIVHVPVNQGYGKGILAGLKEAKGEFVAWSHADLQCPARDVVALWHKVQSQPNPKRCFGKGFRTNPRGLAGFYTKLQMLLCTLILGQRMNEINAQPKLFHRNFIQSFQKPPMDYMLDLYACYKARLEKYEFITVEVLFLDRQAGESKWAFSLFSRWRFKLTNLAYLAHLRWNKKNH
jgi:glycosyltransferase involved in cell wall biosynthesis